MYVLLRVTGNNNAHAFPLWAASNANRSATTQRLEEEPGITNYAQEVANKPHNRKDREWARPRSFERCCTRRHSQREPSVAATAVHMTLLMLVYLLFYPFGDNRPVVALSKRQPLDRRKKKRRGPRLATVGCHGVRWKTKPFFGRTTHALT